jgi:hypothetical protein
VEDTAGRRRRRAGLRNSPDGLGPRDIEHIGSAHDDVELELLKAVARQRLAAGQGELDLGLDVAEAARRGVGCGPLPIMFSRIGHLLDSLERAYRVLGFAEAAGGKITFRERSGAAGFDQGGADDDHPSMALSVKATNATDTADDDGASTHCEDSDYTAFGLSIWTSHHCETVTTKGTGTVLYEF